MSNASTVKNSKLRSTSGTTCWLTRKSTGPTGEGGDVMFSILILNSASTEDGRCFYRRGQGTTESRSGKGNARSTFDRLESSCWPDKYHCRRIKIKHAGLEELAITAAGKETKDKLQGNKGDKGRDDKTLGLDTSLEPSGKKEHFPRTFEVKYLAHHLHQARMVELQVPPW